MVDFSDDTEIIRKYFDVSEENAKQSIQIIKTWFQQQPHYPKEAPDESWIEKVLMRSKYQIEKAKATIDQYYTLRGLHPEFFCMPDDLKVLTVSYNMLILGKNEKHERILLTTKNCREKYPYNKYDVIRLFLHTIELVNRYDTNTGVVLINDLSEVEFTDFMESINILPLSLKLALNAHSLRIAEINICNAPSFFAMAMKIFKMVFSAKVFERITLSDDMENITKKFHKKYLPEEFGGTYSNLKQIQEDTSKLLEDNRELINRLQSLVTDETLRVDKIKDSEIYGVQGSFKYLNCD